MRGRGQTWRRGIGWIAALLLVVSGGWRGVGAQAAGPQAAPPAVGPVVTLALDNNGNGWGWAAPIDADLDETSFLLRIKDGGWQVAADTTTNPTLLTTTTYIGEMALTADGTDGWAIGDTGDDFIPLIWRLQNGAWSTVPLQLDADLSLYDLALSADGKDGWITAYTVGESNECPLLRLQGGTWTQVDGPADTCLYDIGISPDGKTTWATGIDADVAAYRFTGVRWTAVEGEAVPPTHFVDRLVVDNAGQGWELSSHFRLGVADSVLRRLTSQGVEEVPFNLPLVTRDPESLLVLSDLALDSQGRGWLNGLLWVSDPTPEDEANAKEIPLILRVDNGVVTQVATPTVSLTMPGTPLDGRLAMAPNGTHTWLSLTDTSTGQDTLVELHEPWAHDAPLAAAPLPGAGQCFQAVPYCLRGVFAAYWAKNGGLDQFGYPITPEVQESQDGKPVLVQYTERARFEYHPENAPPYDVLLGLLGNGAADARQADVPFQPVPTPSGAATGTRWFPETGHIVAAPFLAYWTAHGGLPVFGLPRSEAFDEQNAADGQTYRVQYFERNRLEYHPENAGTKFEMLLGLLGSEAFQQAYGYAP